MTKFAIVEPQQSKLGGWFCKVLTEDQQTIMFETFQMTKRMAFIECALWLIEYNRINTPAPVELQPTPPTEQQPQTPSESQPPTEEKKPDV